jgi:hypothetical protein
MVEPVLTVVKHEAWPLPWALALLSNVPRFGDDIESLPEVAPNVPKPTTTAPAGISDVRSTETEVPETVWSAPLTL